MSTKVEENLARTEPTAVGKVVVLGLLCAGWLEHEFAHAVGFLRILDLGGNSPKVGGGRGVEAHAPLEGFADFAVVEFHRGGESRATVFGEDGLHGRLVPFGGEMPAGIPRSAKPRVGKDLTFETGQIPQPHRYFCHKLSGFLQWVPLSQKRQARNRPRVCVSPGKFFVVRPCRGRWLRVSTRANL